MLKFFAKTTRYISSKSASEPSLDPVVRLNQIASNSAKLKESYEKMKLQIETAKQTPGYFQEKPADTSQLNKVLEQAELSQSTFSVYG